MKNWKMIVEIVFTIVLLINMAFLIPINSKLSQHDDQICSLIDIVNKQAITDAQITGMIDVINTEQSHNIAKFGEIAEDIKAIRTMIENIRNGK